MVELSGLEIVEGDGQASVVYVVISVRVCEHLRGTDDGHIVSVAEVLPTVLTVERSIGRFKS
jgi:hypothetical protein